MKTIVLLSGGVDSAFALARNDGPVEALTVDYGQRHRREIDAAAAIADHYKVRHVVVEVDPRLFRSSLTHIGDVPDGVAEQPDSTYVPARNTVLLSLAAARAESIGARWVVIGANADDASAYPDCRREYIEAFRDVLIRGTVEHVWVDAPLLGMTKQQILTEAEKIGVPLHLTWSCYRGGEQPCGRCGACLTRSVTR